MKTKQEVIQQHYIDLLNADKFFKLKPYIDEDGWVDNANFWYMDAEDLFDIQTEDEIGFGGEVTRIIAWQPSMINDLIYNNGWTKIEKGLPEKEGLYHCICDGEKKKYTFDGKVFRNITWEIMTVSHYQLIFEPELPLH